MSNKKYTNVFLDSCGQYLLYEFAMLFSTKADLNGFLRAFGYHPKIRELSQNAEFQRKWQMYHVGFPLIGHDREVNCLAWNSDKTILASASDDLTIRLWDFNGMPIGKPIRGFKKRIERLAWNKNILVSASADNRIRFWTIDGKQVCSSKKGHEDFSCEVAWSPTQILASSGDDFIIKYWDHKGKLLYRSSASHNSVIMALAWNSNNMLASSDEDGTIILWTADGNPIGAPLTGHNKCVFSLAWNSNNILASGDIAGVIRLWNEKGNLIRELTVNTERFIDSLSWNSDDILASNCSNCDTTIITFWREDGTKIYERTIERQQLSCCQSLAWGKNKILSSGHIDGTVLLWDVSYHIT